MSFLDQAQALDPTTRHRLVLQIRSDSGTWVDFSSIHWESVDGYGDCLIDIPTIGWESDRRRGHYADTISTLRVRNDRFHTSANGLWDQPLSRTNPLTVNGGQFTSWARRLVRVRVETPTGQSGAVSAGTVAVFEIINISRAANRTAEIQVRSLFDRLKQRDPSTIRDGGSWYRGRTMVFLLRRLLSSSLPEGVSFDIPDAFELPPFSSPHTSSLGQTPGTLTSRELSPVKWITRCMCTDPDDTDIVYFGFEVYGLDDRPGGAIAKYDLTTRLWTILASNESAPLYLDEWVPRWIRVLDYGGSSRLVTLCSIEGGINSVNSAHWYLRRSVWNKSTGAHVQTDGTASWHPCREVVRKGKSVTGTDAVIRHVVGLDKQSGINAQWWEDAPAFTIPQTTDNKCPWINGSNDEDAFFDDPINGIWSVSNGRTQDTYVEWMDPANRSLQDLQSVSTGFGFMAIEPSVGLGSNPAGHRYYMSDLWGGRPVMREGYFWWIGKNDGSNDYSLKRLDPATGTVNEYDIHDIGDVGNQHWLHWPTAFASAGNQSGTTIRFYLAVATWGTSIGGTTPDWASSTLYLGTVTGSSLDLATVVLSESPSGTSPATARHIVDIFTPEDDLEADDGDTGPVVIMVVCDAVRVGAQAFGLYVGEASAAGAITWHQRFGETGYTGPVSSLPFSGFVEDLAARVGFVRAYHFVDQASGLIWQVTVNTSTNAVTFQPVNSGDPISPETHLAADRGLYTTDSGSVIRTLWPCAPDSAGDVRNGYWQRTGNQPASATYVPGIYPLVQYSLEQSDVIDVADFADYTDKSLGPVVDMLRLAPGYSMGWVDAGTPTLKIAKRDDLTNSTVVFLDESEIGLAPVDPSTVYLPIEEIAANLDWAGTYSAVEVIPHAFQAIGEPTVRSLAGAGSTFRGEWAVSPKTDRAIDVSVRSVSTWVAGDGEHAPLMRWQVLAETVFCYLAQGASASATTIYVGGITQEAGAYYAGTVLIRTTGVLQVLDGSEVNYTIVGVASGWGGIQLSLSASIGVDASQYAQVELTTNRQDAVSDGPTGVTTLAGLSGADFLSVASSVQIRRGMALLVDSELMIATKVAGVKVYVDRAQFGTTVANHDPGSVVRAYVCPQTPGKLYQVGDTGIEIGVQIDAEAGTGKEERQVSPGDGVRITTKGYALQPMEHARRRVTSSACITDINGDRDLTIDNNRFCDFGKSLPLAEDTLDDVCEPRQIISGVCPLYRGLSSFTRAKLISPRWHFGSSAEIEYEILSAKYDPRRKRIALSMRSLAAIPNSGSSLTTPGSVGGIGSAIPSGKRRRR